MTHLLHPITLSNQVINEVRGLGLLGAISLRSTINAPLAPIVVQEALKRGLLCRAVLYDGQDTLAFAPPFIITKEQVEQIIAILHEALLVVGKSL
nr:aminotransferase class III-fold pyridoxal phosphate-dependent enzyme [Oceanobacillus limi]